MKMSSYELGLKSLLILVAKLGKGKNHFLTPIGMKGDARRIRCTLKEVVEFWKRFRSDDNTWQPINKGNVSEREAWIAYRLLKMHYFWDFRQIQEQISRLEIDTGLPKAEIVAIVLYIMRKHLRDALGNSSGKLDQLEITDDRHSQLPTEKLKS